MVDRKRVQSLRTAGRVVAPLLFLVIGIFLGQDLANLDRLLGDEPAAVHRQTSLMLDFGNGDVRTFGDLETDGGETVITVLERVAAESNLELLLEEPGENLVRVVSVNNVANAPELDRRWQFWVNNQYQPSSDGRVVPGDVIEWKYTRAQASR